MASAAHKKHHGRKKSTGITLSVAGILAVVALVSAFEVAGNGRRPTTPKHGVVADAPVTTTLPTPVVVTAINPGSGATDIAPDAVLTVNYSTPLATTPPTPTLSPPVEGTWTLSGSIMTFQPAGGWTPFATETVSVPPGAIALVNGVEATSTTEATTTFRVGAGDQTRLEQLLSELNYLPFTFTPAALPTGVTTALAAEATTPAAVATVAEPGTLSWAYPNIPATLSALWSPGQSNVVDKGAIMAFQAQHNLTMDGLAGPAVWSALLTAVAARQPDNQPYDYLTSTESLPEALSVWRNGQVIYTTSANTGVPGAVTAKGTFPVYLRYATTTMKGTNPDGSKYSDPGIPWVAYFNGGDAVHGFPRASYGSPQSDGCVELPIPNAAVVWTMDPYGTLVTVTD